MKKRCLSALLILCMALAIFPATAYAEDAPWATQAVETLNGIYGSGVFTASIEEMTEADAYRILDNMGCDTDSLDPYSFDDLTRSEACRILADAYQLPVGDGDDDAIEYLYDQNIINGFADGTLGGEMIIIQPQFAVITYRVLNSVGGGKGSGIAGLKPGTDEYFSWMYLRGMNCIGEEDAPAKKIDEDTWDRWITQLENELEEVPWEENNPPSCPSTDKTQPEAAVELVIHELRVTRIFSDVAPGDWWYDGVMYLFDRGIVMGFASGEFGAEYDLTRQQLAALLYRSQDGYTRGEDWSWPAELAAAKAFAASPDNGYMTPPAEDADAWWGASATREEAIVAILKQQGMTPASANTAILDRFSDKSDITLEGAEAYIAHAVSLGLINGTQDGKLLPAKNMTRAEAGVVLYRVLLGADTTKMQDYMENISQALD